MLKHFSFFHVNSFKYAAPVHSLQQPDDHNRGIHRHLGRTPALLPCYLLVTVPSTSSYIVPHDIESVGQIMNVLGGRPALSEPLIKEVALVFCNQGLLILEM